MTILVVGASGATGSILVQQLLAGREAVKVVVRPNSNLSDAILEHENLILIRTDFLDLGDDEIAQIVEGCSAIASCLGHNLTFKGIYGHPRRLVTDSLRRLCKAVRQNRPNMPVKFVLMNTTGNSNRNIPERISFSQGVLSGC